MANRIDLVGAIQSGSALSVLVLRTSMVQAFMVVTVDTYSSATEHYSAS